MEWNYVVELAKEINLGQLVVIGLMFWFFYTRLDRKIDKLSDQVQDIDKRLCRIEGSLATQGHCLFQQKEERKVE